MTQMGEKVILSAQVAAAQRDRLADLAAVNERSLSGEVRRALDVYLRIQDPGDVVSSPLVRRPEEGERRGPTAAFRWVERDVTREDIERLARAEGGPAA